MILKINTKILASILALFLLVSISSAFARTDAVGTQKTDSVEYEDADLEELEKAEEADLKDVSALADKFEDDLDEDTDEDLDEDEDGHEDEDHKLTNEHRSSVSDVVKNLRGLAGKHGNIGEDVREVAKEHEEKGEKSAKAMEKIELRNALKTFLFGSDYKNLGVLRSTLVTTENHIERLQKARERVTSDGKVELDAQITALEAEKDKAEAFIESNESRFSLLGWLVKMFE